MATLKFTCDEFRPIYVDWDSPDSALYERPATIFARRMARKAYGKRGVVATLRKDGWASDGRYTNYEAFATCDSESM